MTLHCLSILSIICRLRLKINNYKPHCPKMKMKDKKPSRFQFHFPGLLNSVTPSLICLLYPCEYLISIAKSLHYPFIVFLVSYLKKNFYVFQSFCTCSLTSVMQCTERSIVFCRSINIPVCSINDTLRFFMAHVHA